MSALPPALGWTLDIVLALGLVGLAAMAVAARSAAAGAAAFIALGAFTALAWARLDAPEPAESVELLYHPARQHRHPEPVGNGEPAAGLIGAEPKTPTERGGRLRARRRIPPRRCRRQKR